MRRGAIGSPVDRSSSCRNARAMVVGTGKGDLHGKGEGNRKCGWYRREKQERKRNGKRKGKMKDKKNSDRNRKMKRKKII